MIIDFKKEKVLNSARMIKIFKQLIKKKFFFLILPLNYIVSHHLAW